MHRNLPKILATSVVRSAHPGEAHGGVYLVDLGDGSSRQLVDWARGGIDWSGRGGDRGLRGIAFRNDRIFLAASDELFVFDRDFNVCRSYRNQYLKHCHEIAFSGDLLYLTSTGFDSVLVLDVADERFIRGYCVRHPNGLRRRLGRVWRSMPDIVCFDPELPGGPQPLDSTHINHVWPESDGSFYVAGTKLGYLVHLDQAGRVIDRTRIPFGSHNARPTRDGVLLNCTRQNEVRVYAEGKALRTIRVPVVSAEELLHTDLPNDYARAGFNRGLACWEIGNETVVIFGSSPATVTAASLATGEILASVNITMDVRNAIHGLEIWPFIRAEKPAEPDSNAAASKLAPAET